MQRDLLMMSTGKCLLHLMRFYIFLWSKTKLLHSCRKYERTKEIILQLKKNEDSLKASINDLTEKCHKADDKFEALKAHAEEKIQE